MKTMIVLISADDFANGKEIANNIKGKLFNTPNDILRVAREKQDGFVAIYPIDDFVDACNEGIDLEGVLVSHAAVVKDI
jgi:hypothetical protein